MQEQPSLTPPGTATHSGPRFGNAYLLLALATLCWSTNHVFGRYFVAYVPPIGVACVRWAIVATLLWPLARPYWRDDWPLIKQHKLTMFFLALGGGATFGILQFVALQYTTALNVSVINSISPVFIVVAVAVLFHERLSILQTAGVVISLLGVLVIVAHGDLGVLAALSFNIGDIMIVINMAIWAIYSACLRLRPEVHPLSFMFAFAVISFVCSFPALALEYASGVRFQPNLLTLTAILFVSLFPTFLAFLSWNRGVELIGANRASVFLHLVAVYTALLAGVFLGEPLMLFHLIGFGLILGGVWLTARPSR